MDALELDAGTTKQIDQSDMRLRAALEGQQVERGQVSERVSALALQLRIADEDHLHRRQRAAAQSFTDGGQRSNGEVERAAAHLIDEHRRRLDRELQLEVGVALAHVLHPFDQPRMEHRFDDTDSQGDSLVLRNAGTHLVLDFALQREQPLRVVVEAHAGDGEAKLLVSAMRLDIADWVMKSFSAARETLLSETTQ